MNSRDTEIRIKNSDWYNGFEFAVRTRDSKKVYYAELVFKEVGEGEYVGSNSMINPLSQEKAQLLMNDLWHCGVRPTDGTGSSGQLKATEKHLDDMRRIVSSRLSIVLKE